MESTTAVTAWDTIWKELARSVTRAVRFVVRKVSDWTRPDRAAPLLFGLMADLTQRSGQAGCSGGQADVLVMQPAEVGQGDNLTRVGRLDSAAIGSILVR